MKTVERIERSVSLKKSDVLLRADVVSQPDSGPVSIECHFDEVVAAVGVASEVMAILCLADNLADLKARLAKIIVAETRDRKPVTAGDIKADGAMAVLLKAALTCSLSSSSRSASRERAKWCTR